MSAEDAIQGVETNRASALIVWCCNNTWGA